MFFLSKSIVIVDVSPHLCESLAVYSLSPITVLMIRVATCLDICFHIVNVLISPLIMYSKFVCQIWFGRSNAKLAGKCLMTGHYHKLCHDTFKSGYSPVP